MKNFIFLSPNFPSNYFNFCKELKNNGLNVLGIGDCPYDNLSWELKDALNEYYKVDSLENYDEVYRAVAFFSYKYGKIDYLESNNEYWLERDAMLRDDFNINTGFHSCDMGAVKFKSKMKANYIKANIPVARYYLVENLKGCLDFINEVGYPVIAKPDNGVGACGTYKINNEDDLKHFLGTKPDELYIMEEFIDGTIVSYDAIVNSKGQPLFETGNVTPFSLLDVVNTNGDSAFYIRKELPEKIKERGRAALKGFGVKSRMVHFEFFLLNSDQHIGKKGDVVALEVNMRPSGGISPSMMNWAHNVNIYKIWADMIVYDQSTVDLSGPHYNCCFAGRRDGLKHKLSDEEVCKKYEKQMIITGRVEDALSGAMANRMFVANLEDEKGLKQFYKDLLTLAD